MADEEHEREPEPTERLPRTGICVPVPKREDVLAAIRKVGRPDKPDEDAGEEQS